MALLVHSSLPRDALPYTAEFSRLKKEFGKRTDLEWTDREFWEALCSIGKRGGTARQGARKKAPRTPSLSNEEQLEIVRLMPEGIGSRDNLPYTPRFDDLHRRFEQWTRRKLTKHEFWRAVSRVGKLSRKPKPVFGEAPLGGLPPEIVRLLERSNPWWLGRPDVAPPRFRRWAFAEARKRLDAEIAPVVAIRGPRQVGKTTIQKQIIEHLLLIERIAPQRILRVQFDELPALGSLQHAIESIVRWYEDNVLKEPINAAAKRGEAVFLFFDELQDLPQWSGQLKSLVDHISARTLVTGSSALRIARERNSLAGRLSTIELGPLRLYEIAGIRRLGELPPFAPDAPLEDWTKPDFWRALAEHAQKHQKALRVCYAYFSKLGGYPRCHEATQAEVGLLAGQIIDTVVTRTIEHEPIEGRIRLDRRLVAETFRRVCRYAGQAVTPKVIAQEIASVLGAGITPNKVSASIDFLVDAMLVHKIFPLELLLKRQSIGPKLCLCDHFVRNAWLQEAIPIDPEELAAEQEAVGTVAGHIIESVIGYYLAGVPGLDVAWFPKRGKEPEVDFVLTIGTKRIPLEVKYQRGRLRPADVRGVRIFFEKKAYNAPLGLVITQEVQPELGEGIIALPAASLLLVR